MEKAGKEGQRHEERRGRGDGQRRTCPPRTGPAATSREALRGAARGVRDPLKQRDGHWPPHVPGCVVDVLVSASGATFCQLSGFCSFRFVGFRRFPHGAADYLSEGQRPSPALARPLAGLCGPFPARGSNRAKGSFCLSPAGALGLCKNLFSYFAAMKLLSVTPHKSVCFPSLPTAGGAAPFLPVRAPSTGLSFLLHSAWPGLAAAAEKSLPGAAGGVLAWTCTPSLLRSGSRTRGPGWHGSVSWMSREPRGQHRPLPRRRQEGHRDSGGGRAAASEDGEAPPWPLEAAGDEPGSPQRHTHTLIVAHGDPVRP